MKRFVGLAAIALAGCFSSGDGKVGACAMSTDQMVEYALAAEHDATLKFEDEIRAECPARLVEYIEGLLLTS